MSRKGMNWRRVGWETKIRDHGVLSVKDESHKDHAARWLAKAPNPPRMSWAERKRRKAERKRLKRKRKAERKAELYREIEIKRAVKRGEVVLWGDSWPDAPPNEKPVARCDRFQNPPMFEDGDTSGPPPWEAT
jgi:hypothetical protein